MLDADIWGFSVPRMLGVDGRLSGEDGKIVPHHLDVAATGGGPAGTLEIVSMGFLVEDESTALMWRGLILTKAVEQFLTDVRWGELDYLLVDMPPGTGDVQMGLARMLPQAEMLVVTTPARNAQKVATRVADMARRSYMKVVGVVENMSEFVAPDGQRFALFGRGGGAALAEEIGAPFVASIPLEPEVGRGRRHRHARRAQRARLPRRRRVPHARGPVVRRAAPTRRDGRLHRPDLRARHRQPRGRRRRQGLTVARFVTDFQGQGPGNSGEIRSQVTAVQRPRMSRPVTLPSSRSFFRWA